MRKLDLPLTVALDRFLRWWGHHLAASLPRGWTTILSPSRDALLLDPDGEGLAVFERRGAVIEALGRFDGEKTEFERAAPAPGCRDIILWIQSETVLRKTVSVPRAARRDLAAFLALEMDRETPFSAEEVFWSARAERGDRGAESFTVTLDLVPRTAIDALIGRATAAGFPPDILETRPSPAEPDRPSVRIKIGRPIPGGLDDIPRPTRYLAALAALLLLAAIALPVIPQAMALAGLDSAVAAAQIAAAPALRARGGGGGAEDAAGAELRAAGLDWVDPLTVLAALTRAIPDDSSVTEMGLHGRTLTLSGRSGSPATLLAALAATPLLADPSFTAPTVRESATTEQFTLSATIAADEP